MSNSFLIESSLTGLSVLGKSFVSKELQPTSQWEFSSAIAQSTPPVYAFLFIQDPTAVETGLDEMDEQVSYLHELAMGLVKRGCQVDLFTRRENLDQPDVVEHLPGYRTIYLTAGSTRHIPTDQVFEYLFAFVDSWFAFQRQSGQQYTLLHTNNWLSGWVGLQLKRFLKAPLVHTCHVIDALTPQRMENSKTWQKVERACLGQADCVIATTPLEALVLRQVLPERQEIRVIPCCVATEHFGAIAQTVARQKLGIATKTHFVLYAGRFEPNQGIETLIKACSFLPSSFRLCLVNRSNAESKEMQQCLRGLVKTLDLEEFVVFVDEVPRFFEVSRSESQLPLYYAAADVCVVPSLHESIGTVAIEAMAAGTPVIASNVGDLRSIVLHSQTGLLIPPGNPNALATAIWDSWMEPSRWQAYGIVGRAWAELQFSRAVVADQMYDLYQSLTSSSRNAKTAIPIEKMTSRPSKIQIPRIPESTQSNSIESECIKKRTKISIPEECQS